MTAPDKTLRLAIVYHSTFGHVAKLAAAIQQGALRVPGIDAQLYQVAETLPAEVLAKRHAPPKLEHPIASPEMLKSADGILFGFPTHFGMVPTQMKALFDACGRLWVEQALLGKPAGFFFSTSTQGGGQESTAMGSMPFLVHHGMIFVPLGHRSQAQSNMDELHGGSLWGAGTFSGENDKREPTELELEIARVQGQSFAQVTTQLHLSAK